MESSLKINFTTSFKVIKNGILDTIRESRELDSN